MIDLSKAKLSKALWEEIIEKMIDNPPPLPRTIIRVFETRRDEIRYLSTQGMTEAEIAKKLKVPMATVTIALKPVK